MTPCPRCGAPVVALAELLHQVERLAVGATTACSALASMRLALPSVVPAALATFELELPAVARALACHASTCTASRQANELSTPHSAPLLEGVVRNSREQND